MNTAEPTIRWPSPSPDSRARPSAPSPRSAGPNRAVSCTGGFAVIFFFGPAGAGADAESVSNVAFHHEGSCSEGFSYTAQSFGNWVGDATKTSTGMTISARDAPPW